MTLIPFYSKLVILTSFQVCNYSFEISVYDWPVGCLVVQALGNQDCTCDKGGILLGDQTLSAKNNFDTMVRRFGQIMKVKIFS